MKIKFLFLSLISILLVFPNSTMAISNSLVDFLPADVDLFVKTSGSFILDAKKLDGTKLFNTQDLSLVLMPDTFDGEITSELSGYKVLEVVAGYKYPRKDTNSYFEGCHLLAFERSIKAPIEEILAARSDISDSINGLSIGVLPGNRGEDIFICLLRENILLVANSKTVTKEVIKNYSNPVNNRLFKNLNLNSKDLASNSKYRFYSIRAYKNGLTSIEGYSIEDRLAKRFCQKWCSEHFRRPLFLA